MTEAFHTGWAVVKNEEDIPEEDVPPQQEDVPYNHLDRREDGLYIGGKKVLKGWESFSGWYWFATELDVGEPGLHFGYVQGTYPEFGYFSEREMQPLIDQMRMWELPQNALSYSGRDCECGCRAQG